MKKWTLLLTIMALVCWLPGQAQATGAIDTFVSQLDFLSTHDATFPVRANYGTVTVYLLSATSANVVFNVINDPDFDFVETISSAWLNVNGTFNTPTFSSGWQAGAVFNPDNLGTFNVAARETGSGTQNGLTIGLAANGATNWGNQAENVLKFNAAGFDAGVYLVADYVSGDPKGYVGEVPLPGAVLLLGAGMARLVAYRRKRQA
jgi:hypothetical protein